MPNNYTIVAWMNPVTHKLEVSPDSICVQPGDMITWNTRPLDNIQWIRIGTTGHLFTANLPSGNWNGVPVTVRQVSSEINWKYSVQYPGGTLDPKITVKPKPHAYTIAEFSMLAVVTVIAIISLISLYKIKNTLYKIQKYMFDNSKV